MAASNLLFKAKWNAIASYLNFGISSILIFLLSPYLVSFLGSYSFGVWKSIQKILTFATVADGRATQALKWVIANEEDNDDYRIKQQAIGSSLKVWAFFLPFMLLIIALLVWNLPYLINNLDSNMYESVYLVGLILGVNMLINPLLAIPDAILVGTNNGYKSTSIQVIGVVLSNCLMVYVAYLGYGVVGLASVILLITAMNAVLIFFICKKNIPWFGIEKPSKHQVKNFFGFSFWVFLWSFVQKLILSTEILLIGFLLTPEIVSNYVFTTYIVQLAISISLITGSAITPGLGKIIGAKELDKARGITRSLRDVIMFIAAFFGGVILLLNKNFVSLWMGEAYFIGEYSNLLIVLIMVHLVMFRIEGQVQDLSLKIKNKVIYGGLFAVLCFVLGLIGFKLLGESIEGIFLGILIGRVLHVFVFQKLVDKMLVMRSNKKIILYIYLLLLFFLSKVFLYVESWLLFIVIGVLTCLFLFLISFNLFLSKHSKRKIMEIAGIKIINRL
ncbi:MAG: oligosaccharide flippase family protein [Polaribacter sp.]|uniref:lipopolysaccharide biosynthesis protein n=1 Tax=Polaribacter sp. TaxID=1920175 RepID=UPI002F361282